MPSKPLPSGLGFKKNKGSKPQHADGLATTSKSLKVGQHFFLQCNVNHHFQTSAELNSERPQEPASSGITNPEPTRELVSLSKPLPSGLGFKKNKGSKPSHADGPATTSKSSLKVGQHFFVLPCNVNHYLQASAERPQEPVSSSIINSEPIRELVSPIVATNFEPESPSVMMCDIQPSHAPAERPQEPVSCITNPEPIRELVSPIVATNFEPESPSVMMCDIQPSHPHAEPESSSVAMCDILPSHTNAEPESPSVPVRDFPPSLTESSSCITF